VGIGVMQLPAGLAQVLAPGDISYQEWKLSWVPIKSGKSFGLCLVWVTAEERDAVG